MPGNAEDCGTTLISTATGTYAWKIQNFKNWLKAAEINSPEFRFPDIVSTSSWYLSLQKSFEYEDYLNIRLTVTGNVHIAVSVTFFTQKGASRMCEHSAIYTFHQNVRYSDNAYRYAQFLHKSLICDLLCDDTLTIYCEIKRHQGQTHIKSLPDDFQNISDPGLEIQKALNNLLKSEKFSDLVITSSCGKTFQVHKNILAARSTVFSEMFENNMKEKHENLVEITDIDAETLEELLLFIYTGKVNNLKSSVSGLLPAADKYAIEDLKIMCEKVLYDNIDVDNAVNVLILADLHHANLLKEKALRFITKHLKSVMETPAFKTLMNGSHPHLSEILTDIAQTN